MKAWEVGSGGFILAQGRRDAEKKYSCNRFADINSAPLRLSAGKECVPDECMEHCVWQ